MFLLSIRFIFLLLFVWKPAPVNRFYNNINLVTNRNKYESSFGSHRLKEMAGYYRMERISYSKRQLISDIVLRPEMRASMTSIKSVEVEVEWLSTVLWNIGSTEVFILQKN